MSVSRSFYHDLYSHTVLSTLATQDTDFSDRTERSVSVSLEHAHRILNRCRECSHSRMFSFCTVYLFDVRVFYIVIFSALLRCLDDDDDDSSVSIVTVFPTTIQFSTVTQPPDANAIAATFALLYFS